MPQITGTYKFAPAHGSSGNRVRRDGTTTDWWLIVQCDRDFGRYLRHLYKLEAPGGVKISEPLWGAHVSIILNETPPNLDHWNGREDREVTLEYEQAPQKTDGYIFLPVDCPEVLAYREQLGLPREPKWPLHLTIRNRKNA